MTINQPSLVVEPDDLARVEELVRYLAAHDGRQPTDDMPLAWWLVEALELPKKDPVRQLLGSIPFTTLGARPTPKLADTLAKFVARLDQLDLLSQRGITLDDAGADDLRSWAETAVVRYLSGQMRSAEELLLRRRPAWSFERPLTPKRRSEAVFAIGLRAIREFSHEHGHTDVPEDVVVEGLPLRLWWKTVRDRYAGKGMSQHERQRMEGLKLDLATDAQLLKEERRRQAAERHERSMENRRKSREGQKMALAAQRGTGETGPVLEAIRAFAVQYGHTGIPVGAVTDDGVEFGRLVDRWRRAKALGGLDRALLKSLERVEHWSWMRTPASPTMERPAPVPIPEDTTQMRRAGLRQFLPAD
ncbi:helicase associated domain-containing protein [Streptomyces sp. NPDC006704]|uniref:helicase associated domain-containing protein n=1 Tax=Streptomyces sp. NPDC006704 TaxID=3364760 RepID=UPI00369E761F